MPKRQPPPAYTSVRALAHLSARERSRRPPERSFDRFAVTASAERVGLWTERRLHYRASASEPSDAKTTATARIHECASSRSTLGDRARRARARALLRPFRCDGVGRARRLVIQTTVPPPGTHCPSPKMPQRPPPPAYTSVRALVHLSAIERSTPGAPECRERSFRPFRCDGVGRARRLVI